MRFAEDALFQELTLRASWQDTWALRLTSVILDPLVCVPVPVPYKTGTVWILVKKKFILTPKEYRTIKKTGRKLVFGHRSFCGKMSNILRQRILAGESIKSLCIDPIKGRCVNACRNFAKLSQAWGAALTVYTGIITFSKGEKPIHCAVLRNHQGKVVVRRACTSFPLLTLWTHFIRRIPDVEESKMVKILKVSLCGTFALKANQELPENFNSLSIPLMPIYMQQWVESRCLSSNDFVALYFSIQQAKGLLTRVPETFIHEGLEKHKAGICRPIEETIPKDLELYEKMKNFSSIRFGRIVGEIYNPHKTKVPNQTACIGTSRAKGGNLAALKAAGAFINTSDPYFQSPKRRMEPMVIGLFGSPGSGKTIRIREICQALQQELFPGVSDADLVYSRSCATQHWDGYRNQKIVVLDDFGQDHDRRDVVEFAQLVSTNQYILPMADLAEKGMSFTSPIIIVTSNMGFGASLVTNASTFCEDSAAIWRRFHLPFVITKFSNGNSCLRQLLLQKIHSGAEAPNNTSDQRQCIYRSRGQVGPSSEYKSSNEVVLSIGALNYDVLPRIFNSRDLKNEIIKTFKLRVAFHRDKCQGKWVQRINSADIRTVKRDSEVSDTLLSNSGGLCNLGTGITPGLHSYIQFPLEPPVVPPVVEVVALPEPAKVRCITVGDANLKCLKPLQMALWKSLSTYPEFSLTHGVSDGRVDEDKLLIFRRMEDEIRRIHNPSSTWLSGDYTAATDNLPMWVTEALIEGILEHIEDEPTKQWARYETGAHNVLYPESSCIEPGFQTSGQLMGSLLSFPLLCMANAFIVEYSGIKPGSYLVNGDDIVASTSPLSIESWKVNAPRVGLSLSMGKNFISDDFCTVNSQLFLKEDETMCLRHTGKTSLLVRAKGDPLGRTYSDFQDFYGTEDIYRQTYIRHNLEALRLTPSSLQVPLSHGGLGSCFSHGVTVNQKLAKECWLTMLVAKLNKPSDVQFHELTGYCPLRVPYLCLNDKEEIPNQQAESVISDVKGLFLPKEKIDKNGDEKINDLTHRQVKKVRDQLKDDQSYLYSLRFLTLMTDLKISDLPALDVVKFRTHFVRKQDYLTLRYKYISDFARELTCLVKRRPSGPISQTELSMSVFVEALASKTVRSLERKQEALLEGQSTEDIIDNAFLDSIFNAVLADSEADLIGDCVPVSNEEFFLSYDSAIKGHVDELGSKGIPRLVRPTETIQVDCNPWRNDYPPVHD